MLGDEPLIEGEVSSTLQQNQNFVAHQQRSVKHQSVGIAYLNQVSNDQYRECLIQTDVANSDIFSWLMTDALNGTRMKSHVVVMMENCNIQ